MSIAEDVKQLRSEIAAKVEQIDKAERELSFAQQAVRENSARVGSLRLDLADLRRTLRQLPPFDPGYVDYAQANIDAAATRIAEAMRQGFISGDPSQEARNRQIWRDAGQRLDPDGSTDL